MFISTLAVLKELKLLKKSLVVTTPSTLQQWEDEIRDAAPNLRTNIVKGYGGIGNLLTSLQIAKSDETEAYIYFYWR